MRKRIQAVLAFLVFTAVIFGAYAAMPVLKTIHGTAFVRYQGDIQIVGFTFISETKVNVTLQANKTVDFGCTIWITGAGINGNAMVEADEWDPWDEVTPLMLTKTVEVSGELTTGTIVVEVV